jgi:hypothetical protein
MLQKAFLVAAVVLGCSSVHAQYGNGAPEQMALAPVTAAAAASGGTQDAALFAEAMQLYRSSRWSAAYGRFMKLADDGHADSARIALLMLRHGRDFYGAEWTAASSQVTAWERTVAASPVSVEYDGE